MLYPVAFTHTGPALVCNGAIWSLVQPLKTQHA